MTKLPARFQPRFALRSSGAGFALVGLGLTCMTGPALVGCSKDQPSAPSPAASASTSSAAAPVTLTLLVTADENGHLLPDEDGKGGAARLLGAWVQNEHHCPGPVKEGGAPACADGATLALTAGDHFNGAPLSDYFVGEPTAAVLDKIGYSASALGNHDLDVGASSFVKYAAEDKFPYVAANVTTKAPFPKEIDLKPFVTFERQGVKVAVVGLADVNTVKTTMADRFAGFEPTPYEPALAKAVPDAWNAGADVVVVLAHECPGDLEPVIAKHPEWNVSLVTGAHCQKPVNTKSGGTVIASPGRRFESYLRAEVKVDKTKPAKARVVSVDAKRVELGKDAPVDAGITKLLEPWKAKLDTALGEPIGTAAKPIEKPAFGKLVATALREQTKADVAVVNAKGIKQGLPKGTLKPSDVYSAIPFANSVLVMHVKGADLLANLKNAEAIYAGAKEAKPGTFTTDKGQPFDPAKTYTVATVDFLYFGGDGFTFDKADPLPEETGMVWQTPVVQYVKGLKTTAAKPLDAAVR